MLSKKWTLEDKLNFINDAKRTNIAKIHVESIKMGGVTPVPVIPKKLYIFAVH